METPVLKPPTQEELLQRIQDRKEDDFFGFERPDYIAALTFANAQPFLVDTATESAWTPETPEKTRQFMIDYMPFAWEKANNCRWVSAGRSIHHLIAWTWMIGDRDFSDTILQMYHDDYHFYGKPILEVVCERYGVDWKALDNGIRTNRG